MAPTTGRLLKEASAVGVLLILFVLIARAVVMPDGSFLSEALSVFLAGFMFHVAAEYSGLNAKYVAEYR